MALQFFTIPTRDPGPAQAELNALLSSKRVIVVERRFVEQGENSFWTVCVDYLASSSASAAPGVKAALTAARRDKPDYKETLSATDFALYLTLRELRKGIAEQDGTPLYAIFTNDQLAEMATRRCQSALDLSTIPGVGEARLAKYGERFLASIGTRDAETNGAPF